MQQTTEKEPIKKQGKLRWIMKGILAVCIIFLLLLTAFTVYRFKTLHTEYEDIWDIEITNQDIQDMQQEVSQLANQITKAEEKLANVNLASQKAEENLTWYEQDENKEKDILRLYERNIQIIDEAKLLIMEGVGYKISINYESEDSGKEWRDSVIEDLTDNSLISSGIEGALNAAEEDMSAESILKGVKNGLVNGIPSFATAKAKDALSDVIGGGLVDSASLVLDLLSFDNVPKDLVNWMASLQSEYSSYLRIFIELEQVTPNNISRAADYYYKMKRITNQIATATNAKQNNAEEAEDTYRRLKELAKEYQANNTCLALYIGE